MHSVGKGRRSPRASSTTVGSYAFSALVWVVAHALYAPGRITFHRLQGAIVIYLSLATIFANAFGFVWLLVPGAFANLAPAAPSASEFATMLYFSLATLTTTGYGDIVPLNPFARSLASLESVIGPFYLAITVARLVTMELDDRGRSRPQESDGGDDRGPRYGQ